MKKNKATNANRANKGGKAKKLSIEDERKFMEKRGFEYIGRAKNFKMPKWMDCAWRRVACGKFTCKICGKINQDRMAHTMKGEDPDSLESIFEDVGNNLKQVMIMIKRDAAKQGIDITNINEENFEEPPEPEGFPLYRKLKKWHQLANALTKDAENSNCAWLLTEAGADFAWYKNTLLVKTYRQLCTRWEIARGTEYGDIDFAYTKYVLKECLKILKKSLRELFASLRRPEFEVLLDKLIKLEEEIKAI